MLATEQTTPTQIKPDIELIIRHKCESEGCPHSQDPNYKHDVDISSRGHGFTKCRYGIFLSLGKVR